VLRLTGWSLTLRLPPRPIASVVVPDALIPLVDDCARRLKRSSESPRRLESLADYGARTLFGRFPG